MKHTTALLLTCLLVLTLGCASDPPAPQHPAECPPPEEIQFGEIRNLSRAGGIYLAGQPAEEDFELLRDVGVRTVINLRMPGESDLDQARVVEGLGMTYVHLPWSGPDMLTDARLDEMRRLLRESDRPVLLHCASANRVGAAWLAYRVLDEGIAIEQALDEARGVGLRTEAYETMTLDYINRNQNAE